MRRDVLDDTTRALENLKTKAVDRNAVARAYTGSRALQKIIRRHLWDEE